MALYPQTPDSQLLLEALKLPSVSSRTGCPWVCTCLKLLSNSDWQSHLSAEDTMIDALVKPVDKHTLIGIDWLQTA